MNFKRALGALTLALLLEASAGATDLAVKQAAERDARAAIHRHDYAGVGRVYLDAAGKYNAPSDSGVKNDLELSAAVWADAHAAIQRHDYATAGFIFRYAAGKYNDPSDYDVRADLLSSAALWQAYSGNDAAALSTLNECASLLRTISSKVYVQSCEDAKDELRAQTGLYSRVNRAAAFTSPKAVTAESALSESTTARANNRKAQRGADKEVSPAAIDGLSGLKGDAYVPYNPEPLDAVAIQAREKAAAQQANKAKCASRELVGPGRTLPYCN